MKRKYGRDARSRKMMGEKALLVRFTLCPGILAQGNSFTQGFAEGLGVSGPVTKPDLHHPADYDDGKTFIFYHFDVYRIEDIDEMDEIGCDDCFTAMASCLIRMAEIHTRTASAGYRLGEH